VQLASTRRWISRKLPQFQNLYKTLLVIVICLVAGQSANAAEPPRWWGVIDVPFQHLVTENGLPQSAVTSMAQDQDGFLWIGAQGGLARWDGYRFRSYPANTGGSVGLPDDSIQSIHVSQVGQLWVGTNSGGLARYDKVTDSFVRVSLWKKGEKMTSMLSISDDQKGNGGVWVGTKDGLFHIDNNGTTKHLRQLNHPDPNAPSVAIHAIFKDKDGVLWVGTENSLAYFDQQANEFTAIPLGENQRNNPTVRCITQSSDGRLWVGTRGAGVFTVDPASKTTKAVIDTNSDDFNLSKDSIGSIIEVRPGLIWIGTTHGVMEIDTSTMSTRRMHHSNLPSSLTSDVISTMKIDSSGLIWIGTENGISRYDPSQEAIARVTSVTSTSDTPPVLFSSAFLAMPDDEIWIMMDFNGIAVINNAATRVKRINEDNPVELAKLPGIFGVASPIDNMVYLATESGLSRYDMNHHVYQHLAVAPIDSLIPIYKLQTVDHTLYLGNGRGVWQIDISKKTVPTEAHRIKELEFLNSDDIDLLEYKNQKLWIGTRSHGLFRFDPSTRNVGHIAINEGSQINDASITTISFDHLNRLWVGTGGRGIFIIDKPLSDSGFQLTQLSKEQGLPSLLIDTLVRDETGRIWFATDESVIGSIDTTTLAVHAYAKSVAPAIFPVYAANSGIMTSHGEMLFGSDAGFTVVRPELIRNLEFNAPIAVTNLTVGGKATLVPYKDMHTFLPVEIRPDANSFSVEFAALDFGSPDQNRYAYQLIGFDQGWIETNSAQRLASYTNLSPGDYKLRVKGSNRSGAWSNKILEVPIRVIPAWYQTWWFRIVEFACALAAVFALVQIRTSVLRKRQLLLVGEVKQRTSELSIKNVELTDALDALKSAQQQLVLQEKMASVGTLTAGIAHEINNPTNFAHAGAQLIDSELEKFRAFLIELAGDTTDSQILANIHTRIDAIKSKTAIVEDGTSRIRDLVKDLQIFSRLGEADNKVVPIAESLIATVNLVRIQYQDIATINCELAANPAIDCRPAQLNQVFMNLIINACQAIQDRQQVSGSHKPGLVSISSTIDNDNLVLEFKDNGCGIDAKHLNRIFEPFYTTKPEGEGMGLGLSISFKIIGDHDGTIDVTSAPGVGTCFTIRLPLHGPIR